MKIRFSKIILFASALLLVACAKDNEEPEPDPTAPGTQGSFTWQPSGGSTVTADSAYYYSQINTIFAFKNVNNTSVEIVLSSLSAGNYSFSSTTGNDFTFVNGSTTYTAGSGSINITSAANNKLSGNFNVGLSGGAITNMIGSFSDIPRK
ncbi:MAG TPA: hypothetical protein PL029_08255 [Bacteroidia bacterium]|nr:hypothetical protein [Bacteroidia bacterium]